MPEAWSFINRKQNRDEFLTGLDAGDPRQRTLLQKMEGREKADERKRRGPNPSPLKNQEPTRPISNTLPRK